MPGFSLPCPDSLKKERLPGGKVLPHDRSIHAVSLADSPVEQADIQSKDRLYVATARRAAGV